MYDLFWGFLWLTLGLGRWIFLGEDFLTGKIYLYILLFFVYLQLYLIKKDTK
jgi:hypothetical protein